MDIAEGRCFFRTAMIATGQTLMTIVPPRWRKRVWASSISIAIAAACSPSNNVQQAARYMRSAHESEAAHQFRAATIELRNAAQAQPENVAIRIELAEVYLKLANGDAAAAELLAARSRGATEAVVAPLLAKALFESGDLGNLLKYLPDAHRPAKTESTVRSYRGMAALALGDLNAARSDFADAEQLDPMSTLPLIGRVRLLIELRQYDAADRTIQAILKLDPHSADAVDAQGLILAARGSAEAAIKKFNAAIAADPFNRALLDRANVEIEHDRIGAAERDLQAISRFDPDSVVATYLKALIDAKTGRFGEADLMFDKLRPAMSGFPPAFLVAAAVKLKLNSLAAAENFIEKYLSRVGNDPRAYELQAQIALRRGNVGRAVQNLEKANRLEPDDIGTLKSLGQAYISEGAFEKAENVLDRAALGAPGDTQLATVRALTAFSAGDRETSFKALTSLFNSGNGNVVAGPPLVIDALELGRLDDAVATALQLTARDPQDLTYNQLLAAVYIAQRDYAQAERILHWLLAKEPNLASARINLARIYVITNRTKDAKKLYEDRLQANPHDTESLQALAEIAVGQNDDRSAIGLLTRVQATVPFTPTPSLRILALLERRKMWPDAIARARALQARFPNDATVADALANLYLISGDRVAGASVYRMAAANFPNSPTVLAHYAAVLAADRNYSAALSWALRAAQLDTKSYDLKRAYVSLSYLDGGMDQAISAGRTVTSDDVAATSLTADVLVANGNVRAAIDFLKTWQDQTPSTAFVVRLASLYRKNNQIPAALALLSRWTTARRNDVQARFALAQVETEAGKTDAALSEFQWLAAQRPDDPAILNNLACLYDAKHDARAKATAERALELAPDSGSVADTLGWILLEQGDAATATRYLSQASQNQPGNGAIQYHFAVALSKAGQTRQARIVLARALAAQPHAPTASAARKLLASLEQNLPN